MTDSPEGIRQRRLREIVASLQKAKGKPVRLSSFMGGIAYKTGARMKTVLDYFLTLETAGIIQTDRRADSVKLLGGERESKREKKKKKGPTRAEVEERMG